MKNLPINLPTNTLIKGGLELLRKPKFDPVVMKKLENNSSMIYGAFDIGNELINLANNYVDYKKIAVNADVERYKHYQEQEKTKQVEIESEAKKYEALMNHESVIYQCQVKQQEYIVELKNIEVRQDKLNYLIEKESFLKNEYRLASENFGFNSPEARELFNEITKLNELFKNI